MHFPIDRPGGGPPGSWRIHARNEGVVSDWDATVAQLGVDEMGRCFNDLSEHPFPAYPEFHHAEVRDLTDWVAPPAWEWRAAGGSHVVFYRRSPAGVEVIYAGRRDG